MANLAPSWRPKRLQNRVQNLKKSMLKNNTFFALIFEGFGPRFGVVFGRFSGAKTNAKSDAKKIARQAFCIGKTNTKRMSALFRQTPFRAKIDEKSSVFSNLDFWWILERFWVGFGDPKPWVLALFAMFFRSIFPTAFWKAKKSKKNAQHSRILLILGPALQNARPLGERKREGGRSLQIDLEVWWCVQHALHSLREGGGFCR